MRKHHYSTTDVYVRGNHVTLYSTAQMVYSAVHCSEGQLKFTPCRASKYWTGTAPVCCTHDDAYTSIATRT